MLNTTTDVIVVSCAGDIELAEALYAFLKRKLPQVKQSVNGDEVYLKSDQSSSPPLNEIEAVLDEFVSSLLSEPASVGKKCALWSIGKDVFVLAVPVDAEQIGLYSCSWCGLIMKSKGQLEVHERMHGIMGVGGGIGI